MKKCPKCGASLPDWVNECQFCGAIVPGGVAVPGGIRPPSAFLAGQQLPKSTYVFYHIVAALIIVVSLGQILGALALSGTRGYGDSAIVVMVFKFAMVVVGLLFLLKSPFIRVPGKWMCIIDIVVSYLGIAPAFATRNESVTIAIYMYLLISALPIMGLMLWLLHHTEGDAVLDP